MTQTVRRILIAAPWVLIVAVIVALLVYFAVKEPWALLSLALLIALGAWATWAADLLLDGKWNEQ